MANVGTYAKRAKKIRKSHPNMSWQNAMKAAARGGGTTPHRKKKRHVSGTVGATASASVGRRKKRKTKTTWFGATNAGDAVKIGELALQVGIGLGATYLALHPLEAKVSARFPMAAKFMGGAEVLLGGWLALKSKNAWVQGAGMGILATGVGTVARQFKLIKGMDNSMGDYTELRIPMANAAMAGLITDGRRYVRTPTVGRSIIHDSDMPTATPWVGGRYAEIDTTPVTSMGTSNEDDDYLFMAKGLDAPGIYNNAY